jgi:hypothetical protein
MFMCKLFQWKPNAKSPTAAINSVEDYLADIITRTSVFISVPNSAKNSTKD